MGGNKSPGPPPDPPRIDSVYLPNDFSVEKGLSFLDAFKLSENASTTRIYCTQCFTNLIAHHPFYGATMLCTQVLSYEGYQGLHDTGLMEAQSRMFLKDLTEDEKKAAPPWKGTPDRVYDGVSMDLVTKAPEFKVRGATGEMNFQKLLEDI